MARRSRIRPTRTGRGRTPRTGGGGTAPSAPRRAGGVTEATASSTLDELLLGALERGDGRLETGRYIVTFKEGAVSEGVQALSSRGLRSADARDFRAEAVTEVGLTGADSVVLPEIGVAVVASTPAVERGMAAAAGVAEDGPIASIDPEYFVFAETASDYLRGFMRAAEALARDLGGGELLAPDVAEEQVQVLGSTWGLIRCRVPQSTRGGTGVSVAVLDTGLDLGHPDFAGRNPVSATFVGQPVQDLHSHGTHCIGTACGPQSPPGNTPRYGVAYRSQIFAGKVLTNSGYSVGGSVLAGMNWAIANRCTVISLSLGSQTAVQPGYTNAGQAALNNGLLMIAAAGNLATNTGAPANSPTIMSVAALDPSLAPSSFSNYGKIEIAAPGRDVFSSAPRPRRYTYMSGTSMACPHVAGCAALWAQSSATLRGMALWNRLLGSAQPLPYAASRVGRGLVQAPP
jgi:subtilisin family serine protease